MDVWCAGDHFWISRSASADVAPACKSATAEGRWIRSPQWEGLCVFGVTGLGEGMLNIDKLNADAT